MPDLLYTRTAAVSSRKSAVMPTEAELHQSVAEYLDWALLPPAVYSTFPAGWGKLSKAMAGRLKGSGLKPGMPDLFVFDRQEIKLGNYQFPKVIGIELKRPGEKPSAAQQLMFPRLRTLGIAIYVCECLEDVAAALQREHVPVRIGLVDPERSIRWQNDDQLVRKKWRHVVTSAKLAAQDAGDDNGTEIRPPGRVAQS